MQHLVDVEGLSLGNIHPNLNAQFEAAVEAIAEAFQDESERLSPDTREAEITVKLKLRHRLETRSTEVTATLAAKLPAFRGVAQSVRLPRGGTRFLVEVDNFEQTDMFRPSPSDEGGVQ